MELPAFPKQLMRRRAFEGPLGELLYHVRKVSMIPPFPWGSRLYGEVFRSRCAQLDGDVLEAGVGMGGLSILFALLVQELGLDKRVVAVDSFRGLPPPTRRDNAYFAAGEYGPPTEGSGRGDLLESFWVTCAAFDVLDTVVPVQGFFADVLPDLDPDRALCFVHVDADLFDSVHDALTHVYDRVVDGGVIAIDDFFHPAQGPARALAEFCNERGLRPTLHVGFPYSVFFFKGDDAGSARRAHDGNVYSLEWLRREELFLLAAEECREGLEGRDARNAQAFFDLLRSPPAYGDIYRYWDALEAWWEWIDPPEGPQGRRHLPDRASSPQG